MQTRNCSLRNPLLGKTGSHQLTRNPLSKKILTKKHQQAQEILGLFRKMSYNSFMQSSSPGQQNHQFSPSWEWQLLLQLFYPMAPASQPAPTQTKTKFVFEEKKDQFLQETILLKKSILNLTQIYMRECLIQQNVDFIFQLQFSKNQFGKLKDEKYEGLLLRKKKRKFSKKLSKTHAQKRRLPNEEFFGFYPKIPRS